MDQGINYEPPRQIRRKHPRGLGENGSAGCTTMVCVHMSHASSHMYVRFVGGTTPSDSVPGEEMVTTPGVWPVKWWWTLVSTCRQYSMW